MPCLCVLRHTHADPAKLCLFARGPGSQLFYATMSPGVHRGVTQLQWPRPRQEI